MTKNPEPDRYSRACLARDIPGATCQAPQCDCELDEDEPPMICPVTGMVCLVEDECENYGCARKAGIDVDGDLYL